MSLLTHAFRVLLAVALPTSSLQPTPISITPDGGSLSPPPGYSGVATFTVTNPNAMGTYVDSYCGYSGVVSSCDIVGDDMFYVPGNDAVQIQVNFSGSAGTGTVTLEGLGIGGLDQGSYNVTLTAPTYTVNVIPNGGIVSYGENTSQSFAFTVKNTGNSQATYNLSASCGGGLSGCSVQPTVALASNAETYVSVDFNTGTGGELKLIASAVLQPATKDSGWVTVDAIEVPPRLAVFSPDVDRLLRAGCPTTVPGLEVPCSVATCSTRTPSPPIGP